MAHKGDPAPAQDRDVGSSPAPRQLHLGSARLAYIRGIEVAEPVDLRAADEPKVDPALRHESHRVRHPRRPQGAGDVRWVAHRAEKLGRGLVAHQPDLEQAPCVGRVRVASDRVRQHRQAHSNEDQVAVTDLARGDRDHQLLRGVASYRQNPPELKTGGA